MTTETEYNYDNYDNENQEDDLEKTLMLAAANADRRRNNCLAVSSEDEAGTYPPTKRFKSQEDTATEQPEAGTFVEYVQTNENENQNEHQDNKNKSSDHSQVVAEHYNSLAEKCLNDRATSRIFYMRNFNNWIKSRLINEYLVKIRESKSYGAPIKVLDMCCGKGGDLLKWRKGNIQHLICADIASLSVEQCESRYKYMFERNQYAGGNSYQRNQSQNKFTAEFISADLTKSRLREKYQDKTVELDLVSCQFSFHYSFESLTQAECMLQNASECLRTGGFFIGTIPDAYDLIARLRKSGSNNFGNSIYNVTFRCDTDKPPIFGAKYDFQLEGVVDCPEFLVHFPTFIKLAAKFGLKLVSRQRFDEYFKVMKDDGMALMLKMQGLETYPPKEGTELVGTADDDYEHAEQFLAQRQNKNIQIGTLSKSEWEAITLYLTFAFQKQKRIGWTTEGKPEYAM